MVRLLITAIILVSFSKGGDIYHQNCVNCHKIYGPSLKKLFFDYLLVYSSERRVKKALFEYMKNPDPKKSLMPKEYIRQNGVKKPSKLSDEALKKAIDSYWNRYKVIGKIK